MSYVYPDIIEMLKNRGFMLLNGNEKYPSICGLSGNWDDMIRLISERRAYLSKLVNGNTTLLSSELYFCFKSFHRVSNVLNTNEEMIYDLIKHSCSIGMTTLRELTPLDKNEINKALVNLQNRMYITVIGEEKRLNPTWGTYLYGTSEVWESDLVNLPAPKRAYEKVVHTFSSVMSIKKLEKLTGREIVSNDSID